MDALALPEALALPVALTFPKAPTLPKARTLPKALTLHKALTHSGGNDRFCARLKTDISASNSGLRGGTRSCLTFLDKGHRDESKMVRHDLR
jgi:hypothetical protein